MSREKVAAHWGDHDFTDELARIHWMGSPVVRAYLNQRVSGCYDEDWLTWAWRRHVVPRLGSRRREGLRVLVLGCGEGWLERVIAGRPEVARIDACDVSEGAVAGAEAQARRAGLAGKIRYHVVDLDHEPPPGGTYDLAIAHSVLHHVERLEYAFPELARALRPGGLLIVNEYVGPSRFQFSGEQMTAINDVLARLPRRLRLSSMMGGAPFPHKELPTEAEMIAVDPSESVRSAELPALLRTWFNVVEEVPYGGTVLQHLLYDVVQNFDPADLRDARLLGVICLIEAALLETGELPSDYLVAVAEPRRDVAAPGPSAPSPVAVGEPGRVAPAVPVRAVVAHVRGATPPPAPRLRIHSRPDRALRHGVDLPPLTRHLHRLATGNPATDWTTWVLAGEAAGPPSGRALVVEEPPAWLELAVATVPTVTAVDVVVPSFDEGGRLLLALRRAGRDAPEAARPAAELELAAGAYGAIFTNGWLGRAPDRRGLARRLGAALAPSGLWIGDEWLGPPDGRTSAVTLGYARRLAELLQPPGAPPAGLRERLRARLVDLEHEGVRRRLGPPAPPLAELLGPELEVVVHRPTGGALLQRVLGTALDPAAGALDAAAGEGDAASADAREADLAFVALAAYLEERLTRAGVVGDEYACFVARRRTGC